MGLERPPNDAILELIGLPLVDTMRMLNADVDAEALAKLYSQAYAHAAEIHEHAVVAPSFCPSSSSRRSDGKSQNGAEKAVAGTASPNGSKLCWAATQCLDLNPIPICSMPLWPRLRPQISSW